MKNVYKIFLMFNAAFIGLNIGFTLAFGPRPLLVASTILLGISSYKSFKGLRRAEAEDGVR